MSFQYVNSYINAVKVGKVEEYHQGYEREIWELGEAYLTEVVTHPFFIDGEPRQAKLHFDVASPIDRSLTLGRFPKCTREDVDDAVRSAEEAFGPWSATPFMERAKIFKKAAELMTQELDQFAAALTYDNGKNRDEAIGEVDEAIDFLNFYARTIVESNGFLEQKDRPYDDEEPVSVMLPHGVFAVICPFNFPLAITVGMTTGALITGNTVVVKPSSVAPIMVYLFYDVLQRSGLPPGVLNLVTGSGAEVGDVLTNHQKVAGIAFTGSKEVGFKLLRTNPRSWTIPIIAELGGKNPCIVTRNADLDQAVEGVVNSAFGYSGQKCSACSRVYVQDDVLNDFVSKLVIRTKGLKVGDPRLRESNLGPVISAKAVSDFIRFVKMASESGNVVTGGNVLTDGELKVGNYVEPTVVTGLPEDHFLVRNELFLPILVVQRFKILPEALAKANAVEYGLTSGIFSNSETEVKFFFDHIQAGVAYANRSRGATTGSMVGAQPFGGWKASSSTSKGSGTKEYLLQFVRQQARTVAHPRGPITTWEKVY